MHGHTVHTLIYPRITTKELTTGKKRFWYINNGDTAGEVMPYAHPTRLTFSQGSLPHDLIQVYRRAESYHVRDIRMSTMKALIAWQLTRDAKRRHTSKTAQR